MKKSRRKKETLSKASTVVRESAVCDADDFRPEARNTAHARFVIGVDGVRAAGVAYRGVLVESARRESIGPRLPDFPGRNFVDVGNDLARAPRLLDGDKLRIGQLELEYLSPVV